ncbi:MAG: hypothetical protein ACT4R6_00435, partial [Gemmatimonadaceae bacterium]
MTQRSIAAACAASAILTSCSLDLTNPNAATEGQVISSAAGIRAVAIGLQGRFGNALSEAVWVPGLVAGEFGTTNGSISNQREFQRFPDASANTPRIEPTNPDLLNFWSRHYQVVKSADDILRNLGNVTLAPTTASGISALAKTLKGWAFGSLAEAWAQIIVEPGTAQPRFVTRDSALKAAIALLQSAQSDLATAPSAEFTGQVLLGGIDLVNSGRLWLARYA